MPRSSSFVAAAALIALTSATAAAQITSPRGRLLIVGGNGTTPEIVRLAVETAGGANGKVVIFPQASELPETGPNAVKTWTEAGIGHAVALDPKDPAAAIAAVKQATFIWFPGGDQNKLTKALENTGIREAILARYAEGALVGGTSAGAAVMSSVMITGEADLQSITASKTETAAGLGLFPEAIVDQHFLKRQRMNRLVAAVLDHPNLVGIGIDETTAIFVSGRSFEVLGKSSVVVIDARKASVEKARAGEPATGRSLSVSVLKAGMRYSLK